jgi:hypothetical protein
MGNRTRQWNDTVHPNGGKRSPFNLEDRGTKRPPGSLNNVAARQPNRKSHLVVVRHAHERVAHFAANPVRQCE